MNIRLNTLVWLLLATLIGKAYAGEVTSTASEPIIALPSQDLIANFEQYGYYTFRQDARKCPSPYCGGIFVKSVNRKSTFCPDGRWRAECYVGTLNNPQSIPLKQAALLRGFIRPTFGGLGVFELKNAFKAAGTARGYGQFAALENKGIFCITSPCFSYHQYFLNSDFNQSISGLSERVLYPAEHDPQALWNLLGEGRILIAAGQNIKVHELAGIGTTFVINQYYLPIRSTAK